MRTDRLGCVLGCARFVPAPGQSKLLLLSKKNYVGFEIVGLFCLCSGPLWSGISQDRRRMCFLPIHRNRELEVLSSCHSITSVRPRSVALRWRGWSARTFDSSDFLPAPQRVQAGCAGSLRWPVDFPAPSDLNEPPVRKPPRRCARWCRRRLRRSLVPSAHHPPPR
jgi:hypothetical protein